jgi:hypothetical protein
VFAAREPGGALAGLPELAVEPLDHRDARTLLESVLSARLDEHVHDRGRRCCSRTCQDRSTRQSAPRSSQRATATRLRCWSCRVD